MPSYQFIAVNAEGTAMRGRREAPSEAALQASLRGEGHWLAEATEVRDWSGLGMRSGRVARGHRVSRRVMIQFFLSLSLQLKAGVDLFSALALGQEDSGNERFRAVHTDLLERVRTGRSLSEAMSAHPRTFPQVIVNLVRAGEASGHLGETCEEIRQHYEWMEQLVSNIRQALIYPVTVLIAAAGFFVLAFTFFIPRFTSVLMQLGVPLPWITRAMIGLSGFVQEHALVLVMACVCGGVGFRLALRHWAPLAYQVDRWILRIPLVGPVLRQIGMSRLTHNLAALYRTGVPLLDALELCEALVGNRYLQRGVTRVRDAVRSGRPLHEAMGMAGVFPGMVIQMTALGEKTGSLDASLRNVSDYYNVMVPRAVKKLFTLFEPVMVVGLLLVVGTVALSVFLPIASALEAH